jgi:hypothetical protein
LKLFPHENMIFENIQELDLNNKWITFLN